MPTTTDPVKKMETLLAALEAQLQALGKKPQGAAKKEAKQLKKAIKALEKAIKKLDKGNRRLKSGRKSEDVDIVKAAEDLLEAYEALECDEVLKGPYGNLTESCNEIVNILGFLLKKILLNGRSHTTMKLLLFFIMLPLV